MHTSIQYLLVSSFGACIAPGALAQHLDVYVSIDGGHLAISGVDVDTVSIVPGERVFGADLGEFPVPPGFGDEPGFFSDALTPGMAIGFDIIDGLRAWDGSDFDALAFESLAVSKGVDSVATPASPSVFTPGFVIATADASGGIHDHTEFELTPNGSTGVFLLSLHLWTDANGVGASDPFWIVFNNGLDEADHDAAIEWVESNLVPAPQSIVVIALGVASSARRRRR